MKTPQTIERYMGALFLIKKKPRTTKELCSLTGLSKEAMRRCLRAALDEGLLKRTFAPQAYGPKLTHLWSWVL